jgi:hypothetical protein
VISVLHHQHGLLLNADTRSMRVRIYLNTKNRNFCTKNGIRRSGQRLGIRPKDPEINAAHKQQLSVDQRRRNELEGCFGSGKRKYSLGLFMARQRKGAETSTSIAFLVLCAERVLRLLRLFFVLILSWFCVWCWSSTLRMAFRNIRLLETANWQITA